MKLNEKLESLEAYPFHMPGHKRNPEFNIYGSDIDITEVADFDDLHKPNGILLELENELTKIYGSNKSIISVNGSTCCILSAISAVCNKGDTILIARNCHKSVYNACYINELKVCYIEPEYDEKYGIYTRVTQETVDKEFCKNKNAKAIVITSPTYEGFISNIKADIPVIIDSAHGSHFGMADFLPKRSVGDIVINSLHKTLPSLTQTAVVHIYNEQYTDKVKKYMDIFETSSPSYVLLSSVGKCIDFIRNSEKAFNDYQIRLDNFYKEVEGLENIDIIKNDDATRICVTSKSCNAEITADILRLNLIEPEAVLANHVILISTVCDTDYGFELLKNALKAINRQSSKNSIENIIKPDIPQKVFETYEVNETVRTNINQAVDKICGEYIYAYPPGTPIIAPGERIDTKTILHIKQLINLNINVLSDSNLLPDFILTKRD